MVRVYYMVCARVVFQLLEVSVLCKLLCPG